MKITDVKTFIVFAGWRNWIFVKVETDRGIHGVGEATLEGKEHAVTGAIKDLSNYLVGKDPRQIELHLRNMYRDPFWRGGVVLNTAISAVEIALWDIVGKTLNQPVYALLGGRMHSKIRAYANGWYFGAQKPDEYAQLARETVNRGFTALKWDPFRRSDLEVSRDDCEFAGWYVQVAPHNPNGPVAMAATLQAAACIPNIVILEYLMADPPWRQSVVTHDYTIDQNGYINVPEIPGIGTDIIEEELLKHPYQAKTLNFFSEESVLESTIYES